MNDIRRAFSYDLRFGILRRWYLFLPAALWGLYCAWRVDAACGAGQALGVIAADSAFTVCDVLVYAFRGMVPYLPIPGEPFEIPIEWLLWFIYIALITLQYPYRHLCGIGQQQLVRFRARRVWWMSKCLWCVCTVLMTYGVFLLTLFGYVAVRGTMDATVSLWMSELLSFPLRPASAALGFGNAVSLTALTMGISVTLVQWQTTLLLFIKPMGSFLIVLAVLVSSAYFTSPLLIGNFAMWIRSDCFSDGGLSASLGALIGLIYYAGGLISGGIRFSRYSVITSDSSGGL